jgi:hypothetical protein
MQKAWSNLSKGVISNNSQKYLKDLTESEIKAIEKICWYEMKYLGYQPDFSNESLAIISEDWLEELNQKEHSDLEFSRPEGVKANMQAKAKFYQR